MKTTLHWLMLLVLTGSMMAQEATPTGAGAAAEKHNPRRARRSAASKPAGPSIEDQIRELREMLLQQQQQLNSLQQTVQQRDQQLQQTRQQLQEAQQAAQTAQQAAQQAQTTAEQQKQSVVQAQSDIKDVQTTLTNTASESQQQQKKMAEVLAPLSRFRMSGDIRVRQEDFFYGCSGVPGCGVRPRERVRLRLGIDGKLGQDFIGGVALASGAITDPTSTNETLSNVFERKAISFDRGYISYQPQNHKWLQLWGGKFAYTWARTSYTFDPDLNPEGFSEKLSFDLKSDVFTNISITGIQLLYNESSKGADSFAAGGQFGMKWAFGKRIDLSPSFTILNWRNTGVILNEPASVTGSSTSTVFAPNGMTNCIIAGAFCSKFLYADFILPVTVKTGMDKLPFNVLAEYEQNLNADRSIVVDTAGTPAGTLGPQDKAYGIDVGFGRQKQQGDVQFGYEFRRVGQDAVIASFAESDQRAPTNILQHRMYFLYKLRNNVQAAATMWVGRTLNTSLINALREPGTVPGQADPWLKRMQFDVIYSF